MRIRTALTTPSSALAMTLAFAGTAFAQSTGSKQFEELVVSANRIQDSVGGLIAAEQIAKARSSVTAEYLETQQAGQSIVQSLNLLPGVNFTNNDPYGSSGGNIRLHSFDGNRISVTFDGVPLNDTGNYAIYTNQLLDPEIIGKTTVNQGTTDIDSPTASATGGTINIVSIDPSDTFRGRINASYGSFDFKRVAAVIEPGAIGPWGTTSFFGVSYQKYDKFKGPGSLEKWQFNGKVVQNFGEENFVKVGFHYNRNRNNAYRSLTRAELSQFGWKFDYFDTCGTDAPTAGTRDNDNAGNANDTTSTASCTNLQAQRVNPSNTGNLRAQSFFALTDDLKLTVDPSYQYVLATGGTAATMIDEFTGRLRGPGNATTQAAGVDLNGDGDVLDAVRIWGPSVTNTHRYGVTASLLWRLLENHAVRVAYTLDYGRHRQTGPYNKLDPATHAPTSFFPGRGGPNPVLSADGVSLRFRDRRSIASLNQVAANYEGAFMDDALRLSAGIRAPHFSRNLNQTCYTQLPNTAYCTTQTPGTPNATTGFVSFPAPGTGQPGAATTAYLPPFSKKVKYDKMLPNVGLAYHPADEHMFYASYAEGLSGLRTDNLYTAVDITTSLEPETTRAYDVGYRYQTPDLMFSSSLWKTDFKNRIVTSYDAVLLTSVDRNVGAVDIWGVDAEVGFQAMEGLNLYSSVSYMHSKVKNNIVFSAGTSTPTAGKKLVESPEWTFALRAEYEIGDFTFGLQGKYTGDRFATDINDQKAADYTIIDANLRYDLGTLTGLDGTFFQLNVTNLMDRHYLGSISTRVTANPTIAGFSGAPTYNIGAPRTIQGSINVAF